MGTPILYFPFPESILASFQVGNRDSIFAIAHLERSVIVSIIFPISSAMSGNHTTVKLRNIDLIDLIFLGPPHS